MPACLCSVSQRAATYNYLTVSTDIIGRSASFHGTTKDLSTGEWRYSAFIAYEIKTYQVAFWPLGQTKLICCCTDLPGPVFALFEKNLNAHEQCQPLTKQCRNFDLTTCS